MSRLLRRASWRHGARHPWQLATAVLGTALGVAVVIAIDLAIGSAQRAFHAANTAVVGRATHHVVGGPSGVPEALYVELRRELPGVALAPVVEGTVAPAGAGSAVTLLGVDPFAERPFRPRVAAGAGASALPALLEEPGAVLASADAAARLGAAADGSFDVTAHGHRHRLRIVGALQPRDPLEREGLRQVLVADIATAQEVLGRLGQLSRIEVAAAGGAGRVRERLRPGVRLVAASARARSAAQMTHAFELNLEMLSALALVVGAFLIYNTMSFAVVQRRAVLGILRALGVSRRGIFALTLGEAAVVGAAGAAIGCGLGLVLAGRLVGLVTRTVNDLYFTVTVAGVHADAAVFAKGAALGIVAAVLAALVPAWEAARVTPAAALLRSGLEASAARLARAGARTGVAFLAVAACAALVPGDHLGLGYLALFALVAGWACLAPAATARLLSLAAAALRGRSVLASLAVRGARASLSRTGVAVTALTVALAAAVGIGIMVDSFRVAVSDWIEGTLRADLYVGVPGTGAGRAIDPGLVPRLRTVPGVAHLSTGRAVEVGAGDGTAAVVALRMAPGSYAGFELLDGDAGEVWPAFDARGAVLVSEPYAWRHAVGAGGEVRLLTDAGMRGFPVAGVYRDYESERGTVVMSRATYDRHWRDRTVTGIGVYLAPGASADAVRAAVEAVLPRGQDLTVRSSATIKAASLAIFDRTFAITNVLRTLSVVVAFAGVFGALMALQLERAREIAMLRAQGVQRAGVWLLVQTQNAALGLAAGLLCLPLGAALAGVLVHVINRRSFGWSMSVQIDPWLPAQAVALAATAALLAGVYPAVRMAATRPAAALRED